MTVKATSLEAESGRISFHVHGAFADSFQPKDRVLSLSFLDASSYVCVKTSYRDATDILNRFFGRAESEAVKLRTLSDSMCRIGEEVSQKLSDVTARILTLYGFDDESGLPADGVILSETITTVAEPLRAKLNLRNSSNPVEKANDLLIAQRQKHNGMSWSPNGSGALAALQMIYLNHQQDLWFRKKELYLFTPSYDVNIAA